MSPPDHTCPHCGWDAIEQDGVECGDCVIIEQQEFPTHYGTAVVNVYIRCKCPSCEEIFYYDDGWP